MQIPPGTVPAVTDGLGANDGGGTELDTQGTHGFRATNYHRPRGSETQRFQGLDPAAGSQAGKIASRRYNFNVHVRMWSCVIALLPSNVGSNLSNQGHRGHPYPCSCPQEYGILQGKTWHTSGQWCFVKKSLSRHGVKLILKPRICTEACASSQYTCTRGRPCVMTDKERRQLVQVHQQL